MLVDLDVYKIKKNYNNLEKQVARRMNNLILPGSCVCAGKFRGSGFQFKNKII